MALFFAASSSLAFAEDVGSGTIEFRGVVNTGACTIAPSSVNKLVNLGSVPVASLQTAGAQGPVSDFELELTNCMLDPAGSGTNYSKVGITFTGTMDINNLWANTGTASNVGILFEDQRGGQIISGSTIEQAMRAGTNVINLSARMQATGAATAGTVKSTVVYVLNYQ